MMNEDDLRPGHYWDIARLGEDGNYWALPGDDHQFGNLLAVLAARESVGAVLGPRIDPPAID